MPRSCGFSRRTFLLVLRARTQRGGRASRDAPLFAAVTMSTGMTKDASIVRTYSVAIRARAIGSWRLEVGRCQMDLRSDQSPRGGTTRRILWDFRLPSGLRFTDPEYDSLRETCKRLIASVRARSLSTGLPQRARTVSDTSHTCARSCTGWTRKDTVALKRSTATPF